MTTLYLDRSPASLELEGQALVVRLGGQRQRPIPLKLLERVVLVGRVQLDSHVLGHLAEQGVAVQLANARKLEQRAVLLGAGHNNVLLRQQQYRLCGDAQWCLLFARKLLLAKIHNQQRLVQRFLAERGDQRYVLSAAGEQLSGLAERVADARDQAVLLGLEGNAARAGFQALAAVLPESLGFSGRKRRPPPDPVNACLSLAYTLLYGRAVQVLHARGLDPLLGFYHQPVWGRASLAADLMEPWRVHVEEWVWQLLRSRYLRVHHFSQRQDACLLSKPGRALFYPRAELFLRPVTRALRLQVNQWVQAMDQADGGF